MKKIFGAVAGLGIGGALVAFFAVPVVMLLIIGAAVSVVSGGVGAMFGDQDVKNTYLCGQGIGTAGTGPGGTGVPSTASQTEYVRTVMGIAKTMKVSTQGQVVAVMVMLQESGIKNYANDGANHNGYAISTPPGTQWWLDVAKRSLKYPHDAVGNDADSVGLFQQRASAGWADGGGMTARTDPEGAIRRLLDPKWGAQKFFEALTKVNGWENMAPTVAAQRVQGSAFPSAYAKWEGQATNWVNQNSNAPPVPLLGGSVPTGGTGGVGTETTSGVTFPLAEGTYTQTYGFGPRPGNIAGTGNFHSGLDLGAALDTPIMAIADGTVRAAGGPAGGYGNWVVIDYQIDGKLYSSIYGHMYDNGVLVKVGDKVTKGQVVAKVGSNGKSTGPHLHFEIWEGGRFDGGHAIDPAPFMEAQHATSTTVSSSCDSTGGTGTVLVGSGSSNAIIQAGEKWLGTPYSWGGGSLTGPTEGFAQGAGIIGFDCSSLVQNMVYNGTNKSVLLPRTAQPQYEATKGNPVAWDALQPGDLLFFGSSAGTIHHVAMYIGNNKIIEAPHTGAFVQEVPLYKGDFFAATRLSLKT